MAHPWHHAERSARLFGGEAEDYLAIHQWFDESKAAMPDLRHRALRHHSEGIFWCEQTFGVTVANRDGKQIPVRLIAEQHVKDDLGWIPTAKDWLENLSVEKWMQRGDFQPLRDEQRRAEAASDDPQTFAADVQAKYQAALNNPAE